MDLLHAILRDDLTGVLIPVVDVGHQVDPREAALKHNGNKPFVMSTVIHCEVGSVETTQIELNELNYRVV